MKFAKTLIFSVLLLAFFGFYNGDSQPSLQPGNLEAIAKKNGFTVLNSNLLPGPKLSKEQTDLMTLGMKWVDLNLKCFQADENHPLTYANFGPGVRKENLPPIGKCYCLMGYLFGHFDGSGSLELILDVSGGECYIGRDFYYSDDKYVLCRFSKGVFLRINFGKAILLVL